MRPQLLFIFNIIWLITTSAQAQMPDSIASSIDSMSMDDEKVVLNEVDSVELEAGNKIVFSILYDYGKLIAGLALETESKQEVGLQVDLWNKLALSGEFGVSTLEPNNFYQNASYESQGIYYRVGVGYKHDMNPKDNLFLSVRYGVSNFSEKGTVEIQSQSELYDTYVDGSEINRNNLQAQWYEIVLSSERKLWNGLHIGFHARLRIMRDYQRQRPLDTYSIPGYGRTIDRTIPAINLYLKYSVNSFNRGR